MSLTSCSNRFRNALLDFLWRQWTQLGVAGNAQGADEWLVDPEALLLFTFSLGRYDQRLFDEVVDWVQTNERWISLQRLKNLLREFDDDDLTKTMVAVARRMTVHDSRGRWKTLARQDEASPGKEVRFFVGHDAENAPDPMSVDSDFRSVGWLRSPIRTRGHSIPVPFQRKTAQLIRLRALFGLSPRAESIAYLLTHEGSNAVTIARATGYARPSIQEVLDDLFAGGYVGLKSIGRSKDYTLNPQKFLSLMSAQGRPPAWVEWPRIFKALWGMDATLEDLQANPVLDYLVRSRLLSLSEAMNEGLVRSGIENPFQQPLMLEDALEVFEQRVDRLSQVLNPGRDHGARSVSNP